MKDVRTFHEQHGAVFERVGGREVVARYRRPERTHRAVRNGVGVIQPPVDVVVVTGDERAAAVTGVTTAPPAPDDGAGRYALVLDDDGRIEADCYLFTAPDRLLLFAPPGWDDRLGERLRARGATVEAATDRLAVFGVHGPRSTEKVASVLARVGAPEAPLQFVRGSMGDAGVTVARTDAPAGETGYEVVCATDDAGEVLDTLVNRGVPAVPFGWQTWDALTLEAGTPLLEPELAGRPPEAVGLANAGLEATPASTGGERLVGLRLEAVARAGAALYHDGDEPIGRVTRSVESPILGVPIAFAHAELGPGTTDDLAVELDGRRVLARGVDPPFVEGSERSGRLPGREHPAPE